jgi:cytokinin dehydrogenase
MDQARLAAVDALGPLGATVLREPNGGWRVVLLAGTFLKKTDGENQAPAWLSGLRYKAAAAPVRTPYWDYLDRRTASIAAGIASGRPNPSLAVMQPDASTLPFLTHVLSTAEASAGIWRIEVFPMITSRFTQPLHKIPAAALAFTLRLQRRASAAGAPDHEAMLAANRTLVPRLYAAGGKVYPPYAPTLSRDEWREHYGPETWRQFAAAKKRFDPANVLAPGAGIF